MVVFEGHQGGLTRLIRGALGGYCEDHQGGIGGHQAGARGACGQY